MITKLGAVITEYSARNKSKENIPVYSVTNEQGFCTGYFSKEVASKDRTTYKIVPRGYFAYNPSRINVGSVDWQDCEERVIVSPLYVVFSVNKELDQQYLLHYLKSDIARTYIDALATGSVRDNLKFSVLQEFPINLRPIDEQRKLASFLDHVDRVIGLRNEELSTLDTLVKSRFVELFGDPLKNDKDFPTILGETLFKLSNGKALPNNKRFTVGIPAYGGNGISWYTDEILCDYDTVIIGRVGFQSGNVHLAKAPLWVTDNAMYISWINNKEYDIRFLCSLMEHIDFKRYQDAGDLKKITQKPFMQMHYLMPPISLQKQYIAFVEQTDKSKLCGKMEVAA